MKEIDLVGLDKKIYQEKLKNGLSVYMIPYSDKKNYYMSYAVYFGSEATSFIPKGEKSVKKFPDGIAHFLEHKMFEQEDGVDPFSYFSESGTDANAMTSYTDTQYICYGTKEFEKNLRFLIQFVNEPYYTDENVEKEKGIIGEELKMYDDIPEMRLEIKLRENLYQFHPRRIDIGGTIEEIEKITKEDLYTCYNSFYQPKNMFLFIVGGFSKEEASRIIHEELDKYKSQVIPKKKEIKEPKAVFKQDDILTGNITVPKLGFGLKIDVSSWKDYDDLTIDLYLSMFSSIIFGPSSDFRERIRNKKLVTSFNVEWEAVDHYRTLLIFASSLKIDELVQEIKNELDNLQVNEKDLERMKKVWIANEVKLIDSIPATVNNLYDDLIRYRKIVADRTVHIKNLNISDLSKIIRRIDIKNTAIVRFFAKEENKK